MEDDVAGRAGSAKRPAAVTDRHAQVLLFGALPCTGGCAWQRINQHRGPATQEKIREHRDFFERLFANFMTVAKACHANDGRIALEWPRTC